MYKLLVINPLTNVNVDRTCSSMMLKLLRYNVTCGAAMKCKNVCTWSPLATAFNTKPADSFGISFSGQPTGLFGISELDRAAGFELLKKQAIAQSDALIQEATSPTRNRKMVEIFDELSDSLCKVADLAEFVRIAHPDREFSDVAEEACIAISGVVEKLNTHRELYNSLVNVVQNGDVVKTTEIDEHVAKLFVFDFEQCGIQLPEEQRRKVVELNDRILQIGQKFMAGAVHPRVVRKDALPEKIRRYFTTEGDQILVQSLYTESSSTIAREAAYKIFLFPDAQQEYLLGELLMDRHELAQICGFHSYAQRAVRGSTVETPEVVCDFLNTLNDQLQERARNDFEIMQRMKNAESKPRQDLMAWDTAYFTAKAKKAWLGTPGAEFAPYFSLGACMEGINILTQALYGVKLQPEPVRRGEVWASDVYKLAVVDDVTGNLGYIYCDFYEREGKPNQDCHFTIRGGKQLSDGSYQNPIVVLMLSLPSPRWSSPSLLSPSGVDNLFHEMGHALHSMLGRTQYQHVTGTRCSTDFAEVPSILMEFFASDPRVVSTFAKHFQTQESIPDSMLQRLCASKHLFSASELQNQVFYSMLDQVYHSKRLDQPSTEILADLQGKYYGLPYVENTAWQLRFSHLVGYGAKYYSYLISRAIASWIWQTYFEADPFSRSAGERYRRECLAHGGGKPPSVLVSDFLAKEANAENFAKSLINEIDAKNEHVARIKYVT